MSKTNISVNTEDFEKFAKRLEQVVDKDLQREVKLWLEGSGFQFLEEVQRMIKTMQVVDTRRLLNSFTRGGDGTIWRLSSNGLSLEVGTNVNYARYVNDGHWTDDPSRGRASRFVPGVWQGNSFRYIKGHNEGMVLKLQYIEGRPYFDNAVTVFRAIFERSMGTKLNEWVRRL